MALLNNRYAPITFRIGFIKGSLEEVVKRYVGWQHLILRIVSRERLVGGLDEKIDKLLPLDEAGERVLFTATRSEWVAVFDNRLTGGIADSIVAVLSEKLGQKGLILEDVPNTFDESKPIGQRGLWGRRSIALYGLQESTGVWGVTRSVSVSNDVSGWRFEQRGTPWIFEETQHYSKGAIRSRLDSGLVERYLQNFGLRIYEDVFYEGQAVLARSRFPLNPRPKTFDISAVQQSFGVSIE